MKFQFEAIGTHWQIDINQKLSDSALGTIYKKIKDRIYIFDKNYSRFRDDSIVTKMSRESGEFVLPSDADEMISVYKKMYDITGGLVTPLIGQVLVDAGYDAKYSLKPKPLSKPLGWEKVLKWENPKLTLKQPALLDFGACGKGYLVDIVSEILEEAGVKSYCVDAGGDMRHHHFLGVQRSKKHLAVKPPSKPPSNLDTECLKVGLENPNNKEEVIGVVHLKNQSLCGSSGNRRAWANFHHIINPETLSSPRHISAVWVIADKTITADILTTALFFVPPEILLKHFNFEYLILYPDFSIKKSSGFEAETFS